jgi:hypothetical protein
MTWVPSEREIASVLSADTRHRYEYFIHRVCEAKAVWALYQEGWASIGDEGGGQMIPFWPHQAFAAAFATGAWAGFEPRKIALDDFLQTWIPGMRQRGVEPAIFPVAAGNSAVVSLDDLDANLRHELDEVYGIE